jgi:hypothetical protein
MKVLGLVVLVAIGVIAAVAYGIGGSSSTSTTAAAEKVAPSFLFSFYGTDAMVKRAAGSDLAYDVAVPVDAASTEVTWFTDRPIRGAGLMTVAQFAALWTEEGKDSFKANPPNVSIVFGSGDGKPKTAIAKMSNTKIVDNPNGKGQLLQATMTIETDQQVAALAKTDGFVADQAKNATVLKTITDADAKHFAVFVDGYTTCQLTFPQYCP